MDESCGDEYFVDAYGCEADRLRSEERLSRLIARLVTDLDLHPVRPALWHTFAGPGGITALVLLSESHIAVHTFPERQFATFNLYCCRSRAEWPWVDRLVEEFGAAHVVVRRCERGAMSCVEPATA